MGREIRRVPANWQHPKDEGGFYLPLSDYDYATAAREWLKQLQEHEAKVVEFGRDVVKEQGHHVRYHWEWEGPPQEEFCRSPFTEAPTCYQIYETVTEGTPTSPVFSTLDELQAWLTSEGYSAVAAQRFAEEGWAPSAVFTRSGVVLDIASLDLFPSEED